MTSSIATNSEVCTTQEKKRGACKSMEMPEGAVMTPPAYKYHCLSEENEPDVMEASNNIMCIYDPLWCSCLMCKAPALD